jgi:5-methylcytosine-specific restriction endonuclease McrA
MIECERCHNSYQIEEFRKKDSGLSRHCSSCRKRRAEISNAYRYAHIDKVRERERLYARSVYDRRLAYKLAWAAKPENQAKKNAWQQRHRSRDETYNAKTRAYFAEMKVKDPEHWQRVLDRVNRRKAKKRGVAVEVFSRQEIYERDNGICKYCTSPVPVSSWHMDHVVPLSKGGEHSRQNVVVSCAPCNLSKGDRLVEELSSLTLA